jgi:hypothetical protein
VTAPLVAPSSAKVYIGRSDGRLQQIDLGSGLSEAEGIVGNGPVPDGALDIEGPTGTSINRLMAAGADAAGGPTFHRFCIPWAPGPAVEGR